MSIRTIASAALVAAALPLAGAHAAGKAPVTQDYDFSFEGPLGTFDRAELQRGLQVYRENCSACHGMKYVSFRTLGDETGPGLSEEQVKAIAAEYEVADEENEGEFRAAKPYDYFPEVKGIEGNPPDMSLLAKARKGEADHIKSILLSYTGEEKEQAGSVLYENLAYDGHWIAMAQPLYEDGVEYADGTPATVEQQAHDVSAFLMWAAEPKMVERKQAGVRNILFLALFAVLLYFTNKKIWKKAKKSDSTSAWD